MLLAQTAWPDSVKRRVGSVKIWVVICENFLDLHVTVKAKDYLNILTVHVQPYGTNIVP